MTTPLGVLILGGYGADGDEHGVAKSTVACYNNSKWSKLDGASLMVYNHHDMHIELLLMKIRSLLWVEATISKSQALTDFIIRIKLQAH